MIYLFKVYALVAVCVFGLAGAFVVSLMAWEEAKRYAFARQAMNRIARGASRESFAISRTSSREHDAGSFRAA